MTSPTISTLAFIGAAAAVGLVVFNVIPIWKGIWIGAGLGTVGFLTQASEAV